MIRRRGNSWTISVYVGLDPLTGREPRVTRTVRGKPGQPRPPKEARDLEARLLVEAGNGEHREARVTVDELLARWIEHTGPDLSPKTLHEYQWCVDRMTLPRIGTVRIDKLTPAVLDRLYRTLRDGGGRNGTPLAPATIRQVHAILRRSLVHVERWGWINRNPATLASPPKVHRREIVPPSPEPMRRILAAARDDSPDLGVAVWLAAITGARRGELCGLRWSDLEDESFVIRRSVASLSDHPSAAEPLRPDAFTDRFRRRARRLGLACRLHDLRHWHVTQALEAGLPVRDVADSPVHHDHGRTFGRQRPIRPSPTQAPFRINLCGSRLPARPASHGNEKPSPMGHSERSRGTQCRGPIPRGQRRTRSRATRVGRSDC